MNEWLKVLVGTVVGFASAVLLEPVKQRVAISFAARQAEKEIYNEIGNLYSIFCLADERTDETFCSQAFTLGVTDAHDYYYSHEREVYYAIKRNVEIRGFYEVFNVIRGLVQKGDVKAVHGAIRVADEFRHRFENNFLNEERVTSGAKKRDKVARQAKDTPLTKLSF